MREREARGRSRGRRARPPHRPRRDSRSCGHIGLTPQSVHALGGFKVQGRGDDAVRPASCATLSPSRRPGAFAIVLEADPAGRRRARLARDHHSRPSASALASTATARCWSVPICSAWVAVTRPSSPSASPSSPIDIVGAMQTYVERGPQRGLSRPRNIRTRPMHARPTSSPRPAPHRLADLGDPRHLRRAAKHRRRHVALTTSRAHDSRSRKPIPPIATGATGSTEKREEAPSQGCSRKEFPPPCMRSPAHRPAKPSSGARSRSAGAERRAHEEADAGASNL